jgi:hypothetical protein
MAIRLTIGGVVATGYLLAGTVSISTTVNGRDTASFDLRDRAGTYSPAVGAEVVVTDTTLTRVAATAPTFTRAGHGVMLGAAGWETVGADAATNLLTADQSNGEGASSGWTNNGAATATLTTTDPIAGTKSILVSGAASSASATIATNYISVAFTPTIGVRVWVAVKVRNPSGSATIQVALSSNGTTAVQAATLLPGETRTLFSTWLPSVGTATTIRMACLVNDFASGDFTIDEAIHVTAAWPHPWVVGGSARSVSSNVAGFGARDGVNGVAVRRSAAQLSRCWDPIRGQVTSGGGVTDSAGFGPFSTSIQVPGPAPGTTSFVYGPNNVTLVIGQVYAMTVYVIMDDGGVPVVTNSSGGPGNDIRVIAGTAIEILVESASHLGAGVYRITYMFTATATTWGNSGVQKTISHSARGFRVAGWNVTDAPAVPPMPGGNNSSGTIAAPYTRTAETLTMPTLPGPSAGAMAARFVPEGDARLATVRADRYVLDTGATASTNRIAVYQLAGTPGTWRARIWDAAGTTYDASWAGTLAAGAHVLAAVWGSGRLYLLIDGVIVASVAATMPTALGSVVYVGSDLAGANQLDAVIHWAGTSASPVSPSDTVWTSTTPAGQTWADYLADFTGGTLAATAPAKAFAGVIEDTDESTHVEERAGTLHHAVTCVSYDEVMDRRVLAGSFETPGQSLADVVAGIAAAALDGEGLTLTGVATGPALDPLKWNYAKVSKALQDLEDLTGYAWWVDYDKVLWFQPRAGVSAPWAIATASKNFRRLRVKTSRADYRNRQYVRAGFGLTDTRTDTIKGNGTDKSFPLVFPVGTVPVVNGGAATVGIRGVDSGKDWYWNKGEALITQDDGAAALGSGTTATVAYKGLYPLGVSAQLDGEVATRRAVEGGSGIHEEIADEPTIDDETAATERALGLLRRHGHIPRSVTFETDTGGLRAGQLMAGVAVPEHNLSGDWLIESVGASDSLDPGHALTYTVTILDGESVGGWVGFFQALAGSTKRFEWRDNEVILLVRSLTEAVTLTDTLAYTTATAAASKWVVGTSVLGYFEI